MKLKVWPHECILIGCPCFRHQGHSRTAFKQIQHILSQFVDISHEMIEKAITLRLLLAKKRLAHISFLINCD